MRWKSGLSFSSYRFTALHVFRTVDTVTVVLNDDRDCMHILAVTRWARFGSLD